MSSSFMFAQIAIHVASSHNVVCLWCKRFLFEYCLILFRMALNHLSIASLKKVSWCIRQLKPDIKIFCWHAKYVGMKPRVLGMTIRDVKVAPLDLCTKVLHNSNSTTCLIPSGWRTCTWHSLPLHAQSCSLAFLYLIYHQRLLKFLVWIFILLYSAFVIYSNCCLISNSDP